MAADMLSIRENVFYVAVLRIRSRIAHRRVAVFAPKFVRVGLVLLLLAGIASGQSFEAQINGTIHDPSGAPVASASVAVFNEDTNIGHKSLSQPNGNYTILPLTPGPYRVEVTAPGFKKYTRSGIVLHVGESAVVDVRLDVGDVNQSVTVSAAASTLQTETSDVGHVVNNRQVVGLPLAGRNPLALAGLVAGVNGYGGFGDPPVAGVNSLMTNFSVSGGFNSTNEVLIDGAPNTVSGYNQMALTPSVEAIAEFRVLTNTFSAEFGRTGGGIVDMIYKSGGNQFHGSAFEFLRNDAVDANTFFANRLKQSQAPLRYNQFGGALGGPVIRNRTFFFVNFEGLQQHLGKTFLGTMPTASERNGDFSALRNSGGQPVAIYDPFSTRANPSGSGYVRDAFPGNVIPGSRINPVAAKLIAYYPAPNLPGQGPALINNFFSQSTELDTYRNYGIKFDQELSTRQHISARWSHDTAVTTPANFYGSIADPLATPENRPNHNAVVNYTLTLNPSTILEARASYARIGDDRLPLGAGTNIGTFGFPQSLASSVLVGEFPLINVTGNSSLGPATTTAFLLGASTYAWMGSVTKIIGGHTLKFGGDFRVLQHNDFLPGGSGTYNFDVTFTQGPNPLQSSALAGNGVASLLLGTPQTGNVVLGAANSIENKYVATYLQEDWKVNGRLTVNLGLRWEYETPRTERYDRLSYFDPNVSNPLAQATGLPLKGGIEYVGGGNSRYQWNPDLNNFSPRIGMAFRVTPKTVFRSAYGISYLPLTGDGAGAGSFGQDGFQATTQYVASNDGVTPAATLSNPFPNGLTPVVGKGQGLLTDSGGQVTSGIIRTLKRQPYVQQWNANLQREIMKDVSLTIGYVGSHTVKIPQVWQDNQLPTQDLALGASLLSQVRNPFYGILHSGPLTGPTAQLQYLLRPFPQYPQGVTLDYDDSGSESYDALQITARKTFSQSFEVLLSYMFQKTIGDVNSRLGFAGDLTAGIQDQYNRRAERSLVLQDVPQSLTVSYTWDLPFGRSKLIGRNWPGVVDAVLGGWRIAGITTVHSGMPLALTVASNPLSVYQMGLRPENTGVSAKISQSRTTDLALAEWFNTSVFYAPPTFHLGDVARTLPDVRSDGLLNFDASLQKDFRVMEQWRIQLRAEAFNLMNSVQFGTPGTAYGTPQFGVVSSQANTPRVVQFAAKVIF